MNTKSLLALAKIYGAHRGITLSSVSTYAADDGKFFRLLEGGSSCTFRKAERIVAWFSENWPEDLEWPGEVQRPPRNKKAAA